MVLITRFALAAVLLYGAAAGKWWLERRLEAAGPLPVVPLKKPLTELPMRLGDWQGVDQEVSDPSFLYADEHLQRTYYHTGSGQTLSLWLVYSARGADRGHHPEVCMNVAGKPEDTPARRTCSLEGPGAPAQQYRFGRPGDYQWVFYWHYTMLPPVGKDVDELQRLYQRLRDRPSSLTAEVFAPEVGAEDGEAAQEFVRLVDQALRDHVGAEAVRGSQRSPVVVVEAPQ